MQGQGRFDLPDSATGVLYLAETPEHAVAERIRGFRGRTLRGAHLIFEARPLALVSFDLGDPFREEIADLCRPDLLARLDLAPDRIASRNRKVTQAIAARIHTDGWRGLRWWSAFFGEWHTIVLFRDRITAPLENDDPEPLSLDHPAVVEAATVLGIELAT
jgi:hypothetical protein